VVELCFDGPGMLLIVSRDHLAAVAQAMRAASVWSRTTGAPWV
jgi:hypothetical protein